MRLSPQQYTLAKDLGLTLWCERSAVFRIQPASVFATLGIVLSHEPTTEEEHKVLKGMLSVLPLEGCSYWIGWFSSKQAEKNLTVDHLVEALQKWCPHVVLGMGYFLRSCLNHAGLFRSVYFTQFAATYHPKELIENTSLKKKTYQDLLNLKGILEQIRAE